MKRTIVLALLLCLGSYALKAQTACTQTLRQARTTYDEGRIHELPSLLEGCLKKGFTDEEKTEAYRLLILSYIYLDEPEKADETMLALLNDNPEYQINPAADPAELINLYGTFRTKPIFLFGGKIDINYTFANVLATYSAYNSNVVYGEYTPDISIGGSLILEKELMEKVTGRVEANFTSNKFAHKASFLSSADDENEAATPELIESQTWLGLSILGQYVVLENSSWQPYVTLGPSVSYLLSSSLAAETSVDGGEQATGTSLDLIEKEMRSKINLAISGGIGIKKKLGSLYFIANARYSYGILNITDKHYDNELTLKYGAALSDITTSTATLSLGILLPKYSPKKLTK